MLPTLSAYIAQRLPEMEHLPQERKALLQQLAQYVKHKHQLGAAAHLVFICTHNSRRSHMSQLWAQAAAHYYGVAPVFTYSGGTEATAFNPSAVAAMQKAGFSIAEKTGGKNPVFEVAFSADAPSLQAFSKVYSEAPNPQANFCALMTCSEADQNCPMVLGADGRVALSYDDPKAFDGTPQQLQKYEERCAQIAVEMLYAFSLLKNSTK
ncbi:protein-tyrosine-phosphatase [Cytophagales bacterium LB-30]|uniref:Protein-tyrosine-phosphatase n=1 Tax=Shiella aurantiaca TaxID=3058365 RepID=A0ABT8F5Z9_9BACT|nr:protein-tyrosine-phosphatase [Shiella aurantiaca]MDN4165885.1 protein-tyrosine-phosphatase [Shiella aurantiaca]